MKLHRVLAGETSSTLVAIGALWLVLWAADYRHSFTIEVAIGLLLLRLGYAALRDKRTAAGSHIAQGSIKRIVIDELRAGVLFIAAVYVMSWPLSPLTSGLYLAVNLVLQVTGTLLFRATLPAHRRRVDPDAATDGLEQIIVVGTGPRGRAVVDAVTDSPDSRVSVRGFVDYRRNGLWRYRDVPLIGHPDRLRTVGTQERIDAVVIAVEIDDLPRSRQLFDTAQKMGISVYLLPEFYKGGMAAVDAVSFNGSRALVYRTAPDRRWTAVVKALVDRIGAMVGTILSAPLMLLTAAAIKLDSPGPVLYRQTRSGLNGRQFVMYKFRTMCCDAENKKDQLKALNFMSGPVFKVRDDPRVTRIGRLLRRYSIDEFPQFLNVLKGDMSLVGPRPPLPEEVAEYEPWQRRRLSVKPGITCLWQVNGRNHVDFADWMRLDLEYIDTWSLWLDMKILAGTVPAVIRGTGAS